MGMAMMGTGHARGDDRASAAAEAAISNPLLDDVNLQGANGILVNITAGPDFTMREFDEVGRTIEEFASEDATVVIGTVLDPDMQDEVRVTVVATGLNRAVVAKPVRGVEKEPMRAPVKLVRTGTGPAYAEYGDVTPAQPQQPAVVNPGLRARGGEMSSGATALNDYAVGNDYLDIPAFLRRQAD
jgi:cell division protein FtsZ